MKPFNFSVLAAIAIGLISFVSRFWRLDSISELVFDEVFYVKFANSYLHGLPLFDAHPPLGKYLIAASIQLFGDNPFGHRAFNAFGGGLIPLITSGLVLALSNRYSLALWAGFYTAMDGLLLVESRYALINIYLVLFGMLSQLCLAIALNPQTSGSRSSNFLILGSGLFLGAAISVKWSGITYLVGLVAIALYFQNFQNSQTFQNVEQKPRLRLWQVLGALTAAISIYLVVWIPHLILNPDSNLWKIHQDIFLFHQNLGVGKTEPVHPYCSSWWSWIFLIRPIAYYYKDFGNGVINYVNAMGNPFLYWLGAIAVFVQSFVRISTLRMFVLISFLGHLLPWSLARRCTFLYHYMPSSIMAFIAIALVTDWCLSHDYQNLRIIGIAIALLITFGFMLWLPVYMGLTITPWQYRLLVWFPSWV